MKDPPIYLQECPQLRLLAIVDSYPELSIFCDHIGNHPNCHQRAFIQLLMEIGTDTQLIRLSAGNPAEKREEELYDPEGSKTSQENPQK